MARARMVRIAEAERVQRRDRPRAHGEDVAQDAADAGRRALIGLDVGGVVVALHLEDGDEPVADIDDAGVLARPLDDHRAGGRQRAQPFLRALVGAVLVPHGGEDAELGQRRLAADQVEDALVFVGLQPVVGDEFWRDRERRSAASSSAVPRAAGPAPDVGADSVGFAGLHQRAEEPHVGAALRLQHLDDELRQAVRLLPSARSGCGSDGGAGSGA